MARQAPGFRPWLPPEEPSEADADSDARFEELIDQLAKRAPADDLTDADIDREVQAVRRSKNS